MPKFNKIILYPLGMLISMPAMLILLSGCVRKSSVLDKQPMVWTVQKGVANTPKVDGICGDASAYTLEKL